MVPNAVESAVADRSVTKEEFNRRFGFSPADVWIGTLGRMDPGKHFDLLLKIITLLQKDTKDFHFILIGDGPERSHLESLVNELGIRQNIIFTGEVPNAKNLVAALDIFCFTSTNEGLPNAVLEAAMAGVSVVAWRLPFIEEILKDGEMALLVDVENLVAFKDAILSLIHSPALRSTLGNAGREHVIKNFSLDRCMQEMTHVYDDLLSA